MSFHLDEIVGVVKPAPQERIQQRGVEKVCDVLVRQTMEELLKVVSVTCSERVKKLLDLMLGLDVLFYFLLFLCQRELK